MAKPAQKAGRRADRPPRFLLYRQPALRLLGCGPAVESICKGLQAAGQRPADQGKDVVEMEKLSPKAARILEYLSDRAGDGVPPSVREICAALQIKSTSTVHKYLGELQEKGYISKDAGLNRSIRMEGDSAVRVPLVGTVTAGQPILAVEQIEGYLPYRGRMCSGDRLFALRVRGDSMIDAGILSGDIVVVRQTATAENGEIVVAMIDDEATVKRFYKENGIYRLQPENLTMHPIYVDEVTILGKVIGVMRFYE